MRRLADAPFALLLALSLAVAAPGEDRRSSRWPGFRGYGDSLTTASGLPVSWSGTENVAWSVALPGFGQSSPVVWDGTVFVTSGEGDMKETLIAEARAVATGEPLWTRRFPATKHVERSNMVSQSAPTPAVDGERLYLFFESGDLLALDHDGGTLWHRKLTEEYGDFTGPHGLGSSLVLTDDAVIVLITDEGSSYVLSVDKATGANRWKTGRASGGSWTTPVVVKSEERTEIIVSAAGSVESFDAADGARRWHVSGVKKNTVASPTVSGDVVVIGSSERGSNMAVALGGLGDMTGSAIRWRTDARPSSFGSPLVHRGVVYIVSQAGIVSSVDLSTGKINWDARIGNSCWASPIASGDLLYFFGKDGETTVLRADTTRAEVVSVSTLPVESTVYGVAAVDSAFLVRTGSRLMCLGTPGRE